MLILTIDNSESTISGLSIENQRQLSKLLSYKISIGDYGRQKISVSLLSKKGIFPTGLLSMVKSFLNSTPYEVNDLRVIPKQKTDLFSWNFISVPYEEQLEAADLCLKHHRGIVSAVTGLAKVS